MSASRFGLKFNRSKQYGFVHTTPEIVQKVRFLKGEIEPPADLWPHIARGKDRDETLALVHIPSDLYVVEISSEKHIEIDGWSLQLNYLTSNFKDFMGDPVRATEFWSLVTKGEQAAIDAFMEQVWAASDEQIQEAALLRRVRRSQVSQSQMQKDVAYLNDALNQPLFVTHVNATRPDGNVIKSRAEHIEKVKKSIILCGGTVYDPTPAVQKMGQIAAIADHSKSLAHYTDEFSIKIADDWQSIWMHGRFEAMTFDFFDQRFPRDFLPYYQALIEHDVPVQLSSRMADVVQAHFKNS